jgi:hypothetical protein
MRVRTFVIVLWLASTVPVRISAVGLASTREDDGVGGDDSPRQRPPFVAYRDLVEPPRISSSDAAEPVEDDRIARSAAAGATSVGAVTSLQWTSFLFLRGQQWVITDLKNPFPILVWVYTLWNRYHFGMQYFGVMSLYCRGDSSDDRVRRGLLCLAVTAFGMGVVPEPNENPLVTAFCTGILSFNHWLTDIGLSGRVADRHRGFIVTMLVIGVAWMLLRNGPLSVQLVPQIIVIRAGIGMIHFIYSARIWRLRDPRMRAIIGRDTFLPRQSPFRV